MGRIVFERFPNELNLKQQMLVKSLNVDIYTLDPNELIAMCISSV